eukprot:2902195-Amphidinium_carterae.1
MHTTAPPDSIARRWLAHQYYGIAQSRHTSLSLTSERKRCYKITFSCGFVLRALSLLQEMLHAWTKRAAIPSPSADVPASLSHSNFPQQQERGSQQPHNQQHQDVGLPSYAPYH